MKEIINKEKGITLVALVVTIIILLILTGVTLNIALSENGIFEKAKEAVEKYKNAEEDEVNVLDSLAEQLKNINIDYEDYVGATVTGYSPEIQTCTIGTSTSGHTDSQDFTTDKDMKWRIWDFDGNTLRIVGDPTETTLTLKGVAGYNNGVWAINEICKKCYSNTSIGVEATSLKRSDIQKVSSYDYTKYKHEKDTWEEVTDNNIEKDEKLIYFGESKSDYTNKQYPEMWKINDDSWDYGYNASKDKATGSDKECTTWEKIGEGNGTMSNEMQSGDQNTTFKQSYYAHTYTKEEFPNNKYYDLIFKKAGGETSAGAYWFAGRYVLLYESHYAFGMQRVLADDSFVDGHTLCDSKGAMNSLPLSFRPIVTIDLKKCGCTMKPTVSEDGYVEKCELSWNN